MSPDKLETRNKTANHNQISGKKLCVNVKSHTPSVRGKA